MTIYLFARQRNGDSNNIALEECLYTQQEDFKTVSCSLPLLT